MSLTATLGTDLPGGNVQAEQKTYKMWGTVAATGNYATGGVALSFAGLAPIPNTTPVHVNIKGIAGFEYRYVKATGKVMVFESGAASVTGNVTVKGGTLGEAVGINPDTNAGVLSKAAATDRTIPIATFLGAAPAVAAAALAELAAAAFPAGVTGDTITFEAVFPKY